MRSHLNNIQGDFSFIIDSFDQMKMSHKNGEKNSRERKKQRQNKQWLFTADTEIVVFKKSFKLYCTYLKNEIFIEI
jgi:hypothetical protein